MIGCAYPEERGPLRVPSSDRRPPQKGVDRMPKVVLTHSVVDVERWLKGKDERVADIGAAGANVTDYVAADGSNNVAVTVDVQRYGCRPGAHGLSAS